MNQLTASPEHEEIAALAHEIYQSTGYPEGCADQHWLQAEHTLQNRKVNITTLKILRKKQK